MLSGLFALGKLRNEGPWRGGVQQPWPLFFTPRLSTCCAIVKHLPDPIVILGCALGHLFVRAWEGALSFLPPSLSPIFASPTP